MLEVVLLKLKKCGFLLSLVMMICFALPSFASAEVVNIMAETKVKEVAEKKYPELFNGKGLYLTNKYSALIDLQDVYTINSHSINFRTAWGEENSFIDYLNVNQGVIKSFSDSQFGRSYAKVEGVRYIRLRYYRHGNDHGFDVYSLSLMGDNGKVSNVKNLSSKPDLDKISFSWINPVESKFDGVKVYKDGNYLETVEKGKTSFIVNNLKPEKTYEFKFTSIVKGEGETDGVNVKVTTLTPVVDPPNNVHLVSQDSSLIITWDDVKSPYFKGYNVYIDGKKINSELLTNSKLNVKGLENGKLYKVQVATVNTKGVEGAKSKEVSESPSGNALTVEYDVKMPFSPLDLLTSSISLLAILGGFVLLSIAIIWFRPLKELIVKAVRREKDKK